MLRFFRRIRQRLATRNSFAGRYLLYALGEMALVVIGILLALQVDTWNSQRQERKEARVFLKRVKEEFMANRAQLVQKVNMREDALNSARELLRFIDGTSEVTTAAQVDSLLAVALPVYTFDPSLGVLNQLTSTDKLTLIENETLSDTLSIWEAMIEDFKEDENMYNRYNHNYFRPFLYEHYPGRNVINTRIRNRVISPILLSSPELVNQEIGFSAHQVELAELKSSREFETYLAFVVSWLSLINTQSKGILEYIDGVVEIIDEDLEEG